jgi:hypothetical protein
MGVDIQLDSIFLPWLNRYKFKPRPTTTVDELVAYADEIYLDYESSGGYFRNAYNESDVMWAMGLSWDDVFPLLDADRKLPITAARDLLAKIEARPLTRERCSAHIYANMTSGERTHQGHSSVQQFLDEMKAKATGCELAEAEPPDIEEFMPYWNRKRDTLIALLRRSIELDEPLNVSG